jgi:raffinose/stachyose/melibiose transport system permease protein
VTSSFGTAPTAMVGRTRVAVGVRTARRRRRRSGQSRWAGLLFAAPAIVLVAVFVLYPIVGTVRLSLVQWDGFSPDRPFVGLANFVAVVEDSAFVGVIGRNLIYIAGFFFSVVLGFALSLLLWVRPRGWVIFRTAFLIPEMMGPAIVGLIWLQLWRPVTGGMAGLGEVIHSDWLASSPIADPSQAIGVLAFTQIWASTGFFVVVSLGRLQNLDPTLLDAASVDGASRGQRLRYVVIPQMRPYLSLMIMLATIAGLKAFDLVWVMTQGGPGNATQLIGTYAYTKAFSQSDFGQGSALAMIMVILALIFTAVTGRRNVNER